MIQNRFVNYDSNDVQKKSSTWLISQTLPFKGTTRFALTTGAKAVMSHKLLTSCKSFGKIAQNLESEKRKDGEMVDVTPT